MKARRKNNRKKGEIGSVVKCQDCGEYYHTTIPHRDWNGNCIPNSGKTP